MKSVFFAASFAAMLGVGSASAATLFDEDFGDEVASTGGLSALNFNGFDQFTVTEGTVDLISSGGFGITCVSAGACVDLDGSTGNSGLMSSVILNFQAGVTYTFSAVMSGNQRSGAPDTGSYGITGGILDALYAFDVNDPFETLMTSFTVAADTTGSIFFQDDGNDNVGAILDRVTVTSDVAAVPLPATALLLIGALGGMAGLRRTRKTS